jgi:putative nucleotidyltransferase with HDIG domain
MGFDRDDHRTHIETFIATMPSLSMTMDKVMDICSRPDVSPNELYKVISLDPVLTGQVLQLINTTYYSLADQITSLIRAMTMLGLNTVKNMALSAAIMNSVPDADRLDSSPARNFWAHSISVGAAAKLLAGIKGIPVLEREEYFIGGLLHDIGKIPFGEGYGAVLAYAAAKEVPMIEAERELNGIDHQQAGLLIAKKWKLNKVISNCIGYHHSVDQAQTEYRGQTACVALGNAYSNMFDFAGDGDLVPSEDGLKELLERAGLSWQEFSGIHEDIESEVSKAQAFLKK